MEISVVIPVYNRANIVNKAVRSIINQTYSVNEIIVVDDGSNDDIESVIKGFKNRDIKLLRQTNKGVSAARNAGVNKAKNQWIAFLDSDDYWLPSKVERQVDFHKRNNDVLISQTDEIWIRNGKRINPKDYHKKINGKIFSSSLSRCLISPSAVLLNRKIFDDVGFFDDKLPVCEDYDLWLRISSKYNIGLIAKKLVVKTGGHKGQLSGKYWGMDRFRVRSLDKIINNHTLSDEQKKEAVNVLNEKLTILRNGALKRGKFDEVSQYEEMLSRYEL